MSNLTLDVLQAAFDRIRALPPIVYEIWFVDSPFQFHMYRGVIGWAYPPPLGVPRPVEWFKMFDRGEPRPAFCDTRGVWARYTDGTDIRLDQAAFEALLVAIRQDMT